MGHVSHSLRGFTQKKKEKRGGGEVERLAEKKKQRILSLRPNQSRRNEPKILHFAKSVISPMWKRERKSKKGGILAKGNWGTQKIQGRTTTTRHGRSRERDKQGKIYLDKKGRERRVISRGKKIHQNPHEKGHLGNKTLKGSTKKHNEQHGKIIGNS